MNYLEFWKVVEVSKVVVTRLFSILALGAISDKQTCVRNYGLESSLRNSVCVILLNLRWWFRRRCHLKHYLCSCGGRNGSSGTILTIFG